MTLKLEVGKRYRTRDGRVACVTKAEGDLWPYGGTIDGKGSKHALHGLLWWDVHGKSIDAPGRNLISEIPEPKKEPPMVKMVVRDEKPKEQVIEWWLEQDGNGVRLMARDAAGRQRYVAQVNTSGLFRMHLDGNFIGLPKDDRGCIKAID